jgi:DNA-binding CsgD family transcriptional regulator
MDDPARPEPTALAGRATELERFSAVLDEVAAGHRGVVLVDGEAGIGKTSLVRAALAAWGAVVVGARGAEAEADSDFGVIEQLARSAPIDAAARSALLAASTPDPVHIGAALVALLDEVRLDPRHPLAVVVDDAEWADGGSLAALAFAARRLPRDPVLLCLVTRPEGAALLPRDLRRLVADDGVHLTVGPLDRLGVRSVVEDVLGRRPTMHAAERLRRHTGGNPLHLRAVLDECGLAAIEAGSELPAPSSFRQVVLARLAEGSAEMARLVEAAAVLGDAAELASVADLGAVTHPGSALDEAIDRSLLTAGSRADDPARLRVSVAHPLVRAAVLDAMGPGHRADLHRAAGAIVAGLPGLRHRLLGALGPDPALWREACLRARDEADRGAHGAAAAVYRLAAAAAADGPDRSATLLRAIDELLLAGRVVAAEQLRSAVGAAPPSALRSYVEGRLAYLLGPRAEARPALESAWQQLTGTDRPGAGTRPADGQLAGRVAASLATAAVDDADGDAAVAWCRVALDLAPLQAAQGSVTHMLAGAHALGGQFDEGLREVDERSRNLLADPAAPAAAVADASSARGLLRLWTHDLPGAADDLERALAHAGAGSSFVALESARFYLAEVRYRQGRWDDALMLAEQSTSLIDDTDQAWMAAIPHATAAQVVAARGGPAQEHLDRAWSAVASVGRGVSGTLVRVAALEVATCRRDHAAAVELVDPLLRSKRPVDERVAGWRANAARALAVEGRLADARTLVEELQAHATTPLVATEAARARVMVCVIGNDDVGLDEAAEHGLALDPDLVGPYPRARLELAVGRAWRRRGERRDAVRVLEAALARFRALDAAPWEAQVAAEVAASGLRPSRAPAAPGAELTPQERAVARLVATGLTNREVAAELVVSTKTIEHHLSRVYAKLGVRSRTELAIALPEG